MNKNIEVVDEAGNMYEPTWPKRAKGLVKHGRARFVDENRICLACPPDTNMEETHMNEPNNIFGGITVADILNQINKLIHHTQNIYITCETLATMNTDDGDNDTMSEDKANAFAAVVQCRETTNQQILRLYEKMYNDLIRLGTEQPKETE